MKRLLLRSVFALIVSQLCCRDIEEPVLTENFHPLKIGYTWIYEVDSTFYDEFLEDSFNYHMMRKEEVVSSFIAGSDSTETFLVNVYVRNSASQKWAYIKSYSAQNANYKSIRTTNNTPVVVLVYPVVERKSWDANQLNTGEFDQVRYLSVGFEHLVDSMNYPSTLTVEQENFISALETDVRWEVYAPNIGLIEKNVTKTRMSDGKKSGVHYSWKLKSYSHP